MAVHSAVWDSVVQGLFKVIWHTTVPRSLQTWVRRQPGKGKAVVEILMNMILMRVREVSASDFSNIIPERFWCWMWQEIWQTNLYHFSWNDPICFMFFVDVTIEIREWACNNFLQYHSNGPCTLFPCGKLNLGLWHDEWTLSWLGYPNHPPLLETTNYQLNF